MRSDLIDTVEGAFDIFKESKLNSEKAARIYLGGPYIIDSIKVINRIFMEG